MGQTMFRVGLFFYLVFAVLVSVAAASPNQSGGSPTALPVSFCKAMPVTLKNRLGSLDHIFDRPLEGEDVEFNPTAFEVCYEPHADAIWIRSDFDVGLEEKMRKLGKSNCDGKTQGVMRCFYSYYYPGTDELYLNLSGPKGLLYIFVQKYATALQKSESDPNQAEALLERTAFIVRVFNNRGESVEVMFDLEPVRRGPPRLVPDPAVRLRRLDPSGKHLRPPEMLTLERRDDMSVDYPLVVGHRHDLAGQPTDSSFLFTFFGH